MPDPQNQQRQDRRPTIEILNDAPVKGVGVWEITTWTIVKRGETPLSGVTVRFFSSGQEMGSGVTDSDGRTNPLLVTVPANKTMIHVEVYGDTNPTVSNRKNIVISQGGTQARKTADKWKPVAEGSNGRYVVHISLTSQDRLPLEGVMIHVTDPKQIINMTDTTTNDKDDKTLVVSGRTDEDGYIALVIPPFTERYRSFTVTAPGTQLDPEPLRLAGPTPSKWRKPSPPPEELPIEFQGGFSITKTIQAAIAAFCKGRADAKQNRSS